MLTPTKYSKPDDTVLAAATVVLSVVRQTRLSSYDDLMSTLKSRTRSAEYLFTPALNFLYLLGLIEYRAAVDAFEYVGK